MANKKRHYPKKTAQSVARKPEINLEEVQAQTLVSIEQITSQAPRINGVSILQCCTYDVIQMLNGSFAGEISK